GPRSGAVSYASTTIGRGATLRRSDPRLSTTGLRLAPALLGEDRLHLCSRARGVRRLLGGSLLDHRDLGRSDDDAGAALCVPGGGARAPVLLRDDRPADADPGEPFRVSRGFAGDTSRAAALRAEPRQGEAAQGCASRGARRF